LHEADSRPQTVRFGQHLRYMAGAHTSGELIKNKANPTIRAIALNSRTTLQAARRL